MGANAQTTVPTFTASQVLTAAQMNDSARTGVPVFATTTTRDAGFGGTGEKTLAEGQLCYIEASDETQYYTGTAWKTVNLQSKLITSTRDLTAASGNVSYTGTGFTPTAIIQLSFITASIASIGFADSARADLGFKMNVTATYESGVVYFETSSNNYQTASVASYDSDGFTLTWTKVNSPTGTVNLGFLCLR